MGPFFSPPADCPQAYVMPAGVAVLSAFVQRIIYCMENVLVGLQGCGTRGPGEEDAGLVQAQAQGKAQAGSRAPGPKKR